MPVPITDWQVWRLDGDNWTHEATLTTRNAAEQYRARLEAQNPGASFTICPYRHVPPMPRDDPKDAA